ncbi:aldo/keto reductase [Paenarthrobacter sp. DKR-5]|uniref:aldo/keto reductase n=1 Tax=Paenarthrobacter sp. DKR-5 TaxID=2835535 RepID=UPI001BDBF309|nr:aldo/keto reductase [Paenarthrobacter sp. DKR-5]MBT1001786.1 aldo/keto reductase [Paenarthrobacter sp. DKR-5]
MEQRYVGRSGLKVSSIGLGLMSWGAEVDESGAQSQLRSFLDAGGTFLDTSAGFADGRSEAVLGSLLGDVVARSEVVIASKAGTATTAGRREVDTSRRAMLQALDGTLARLGTDHLDLWFAQSWDRNVPLEETLSALDHAVATGRVRYAGVSGFNGWQTAKAAALSGAGLTACQHEYSLVQRAAERDVMPAAEDAGLGMVCWAPLGRGVLTGKYRGHVPADSRAAGDELAAYVQPYLAGRPARIVEAVATAANGLDREPLDVALSWVLGQPLVASAVVGARTEVQLKQILSAKLTDLPAQIAAVLDEVSALPA